MPEWDIWPSMGPSRINAWARQGAAAFPQAAAGGASPLPSPPPQAASSAAVPPPAGSTRPPTLGNMAQFLGLIPAPFIDLPGLQPMLNTPLMSDERAETLPPGFGDALATATPTSGGK